MDGRFKNNGKTYKNITETLIGKISHGHTYKNKNTKRHNTDNKWTEDKKITEIYEKISQIRLQGKYHRNAYVKTVNGII